MKSLILALRPISVYLPGFSQVFLGNVPIFINVAQRVKAMAIAVLILWLSELFSEHHQGGELGVPVFDDGNWFKVSYRSCGQIMADAYPEEMVSDKAAYIVWAWCSPCEPKDMIIPRREDYPEYDFWEGPFPADDSTFI